MTDLPPDPRTQLQAIRDEAHRRAASWLALLPRKWRPLDALTRQIAPALGREYLGLTRRKMNLDPTGEAGRKRLAKDVLKRLVSIGICDTHTDSDGQKTFARVRCAFSCITALPAPAESRSLADAVVTVRDLNARDRRRIAVIDGEGGNPWGLPDPMEVVTCPQGRGVVALVGKMLVGYAAYTVLAVTTPLASVAYLDRIAVAAEWRGKGIGTLLLQAAEARVIREGAAAGAEGMVMMTMHVPEPCLPLQILSRGLGYAAVGDSPIQSGLFVDVDCYWLIRCSMWLRPTAASAE